ncbi:hypothetical protein MASSI9I_20946 [Massilia sp. 9I]|nr:hypothetical protein MASSI9I_20946 [Massilia sp. 9I]
MWRFDSNAGRSPAFQTTTALKTVIPAQAGIQVRKAAVTHAKLDSRLRGNDVYTIREKN